MARTDALNVFDSGSTKAKLAESYGQVIENLEKNTISALIKNKNLSGDPTTGSVEARRIENTSSNTYGTARSGGAGQAIKAAPVVININTNKEIINEVEEKDLSLLGVDGLIAKKTASNEKAMKRELERAFFAEAVSAGTAATLSASTAVGKLEELIQKIETLSNSYIDGVERDSISVIVKPAIYGELRTALDSVAQGNVKTNIEEFGMYHGVKVFSSVYLPDGYDYIAMADEAIAQPVMTSVYNPEKIPLTDAYAFGIFYYYGTKAVMADTIFKVASANPQ